MCSPFFVYTVLVNSFLLSHMALGCEMRESEKKYVDEAMYCGVNKLFFCGYLFMPRDNIKMAAVPLLRESSYSPCNHIRPFPCHVEPFPNLLSLCDRFVEAG